MSLYSRISKGVNNVNKFAHHFLCIAALCATCVASADVIPYLAPRSQGINGARELVGWQSQINKWDMCCNYGSFSITPEFTRTFHTQRIAEALFCDALTTASNSCYNNCHNNCNSNCGDKILIQGSQLSGRNSKALMAENFYLPTDYSSIITLKPRVQNFLVDFNYYQGLDEWIEGLYFRIHTPVTWTSWDLNYCEKIVNAGTNPMDTGYFNDTLSYNETGSYGLSRSKLLESFEQYISDVKSIEDVTDITYNPLKAARWNKCHMSKTRLAEITAAFGWNFVRRENFLFGLNIRAAAPTGNKPHGTYIFEPIVGNGHHWELGGGMNMWWTWWKNCSEDHNFTMYLDAYATHMFKNRQCRTFDLVGKPLSRYMLAEKFDTQVTNLYYDTDTAPTAQFEKVFTPVANLTTLPVDVSYAAQGELILKFAYTHCNYQLDFGYDFWGRTCAKICKRCDCCDTEFRDNVWGLKGDAFTFGFPYENDELTARGVPLSATESKATIFKGTNNYPYSTSIDDEDIEWYRNPGVDNAQKAYQDAANDIPLVTINGLIGQVYTSAPSPILLTETDIDLCNAKTKAYSNKLFAHFGYTWKEHECWTPYLGIGGEAEFGARNKCNDASNASCHTGCHSTKHDSSNCSKSDCTKFAFSQWGIWLKGGFSFN